MKLLFVGVVPGDNLKKALLAGGFSIETTKKLPLLQKFEIPELIVIFLKNHIELKDLEKLKEKFPRIWISVVIDRQNFRNPTWQNSLLASKGKDDVLISDLWEHTFWFSIQKAGEHKILLESIKKLQAECKGLKSHYNELSSTSDKLLKKFEKDVDLATNIQRSLLPKVSPQIPGVSLAVKYIPATGLGGDYYDIFEFGDRKRFGVLVADSQTHGMAAALLSVLLKVRLEKMKERFPCSKSFVEYLNREIQNLHEKELASMSLLYGIIDRSSLTFQYTVAGSINPILWRQGNAVSIPTSNNPPLGGMDHYAFRESTLSLHPSDLLIIHTDGLEAPLTQGRSSKSALEKIVQILAKKDPSPDPLEVQVELMGLIDRFIDNKPLSDDLTLIHFAIDARALYIAKNSDESN